MNGRKTAFLSMMLALLLVVSGCAPRSLPEQSGVLEGAPSISEPPPASSEPVKEEPEFVPLDVGGLGHTAGNGPLQTTSAADGDVLLADEGYSLPETWRICVYDPQQEGYVVHYYDRGDDDTAGQLAKTALQYLYAPEDGIDVASVRMEKSMAVVDLQLTAGSPAEKALQDKAAVETVLHSVATTLNNSHFSHTGFLLNGGQFSLGGVMLEDDSYGSWAAVELFNQPVTEEEFSGLRALLPYPSHEELPPPMLTSNIKIQAEYPELYSLLYRAGDTGEYASPAEIDAIKKVAAGLGTAPDILDCKDEPEKYSLYPADDSFLMPLIMSVLDGQFTPREWVEEAAKSIWGSEVTLRHGDADVYTYHPKEGVYTPPHRGGGRIVEPYFHSIEKTDNGFSAVVSYLVIGMTGVYVVQAEEEWIEVYGDYEEDPRVQELLYEKLPRYQVTASTGDDGKLYLRSSELL